MTLFDHIVSGIVVLVFPIYVILSYAKIKPALLENQPGARRREYAEAMVSLWILLLVVAVNWIVQERSFDALGLGFSAGLRFWAGAVLVAAIGALLFAQLKKIRSDAAVREELRKQFGSGEEYLPRTDAELRRFQVLSVTAGICEEVVYRGFLMWYIGQFAGTIAAVLASAVVFALAHLYSGTKNSVRSGLVGLVLAGLYLLTGSLWVPIALHIILDLNAGWTARAVDLSPETG